jgi:hypothetical protein
MSLGVEMDNQTWDAKGYSAEQRDLVSDWCEKWLELSALINEVTGTPEPPSDLDELRYWSFRFWFIDHQAEFVQLWGNFSRSKYLPSNQASYIEEGTDSKDMEKYFKNPFAYFYEPKDLYVLAQQLDLQCGVDIWEPSEHRASVMRPTLVRMGETMMEFVNWIPERPHL